MRLLVPIVRQELKRRLDKAREKLIKTITLISPEGEHVEVTNLYKWCRDNNMNYNKMRWVTRSPTSLYKGWKKLN